MTRIRCCIPFCGRSKKWDGEVKNTPERLVCVTYYTDKFGNIYEGEDEWICGKHWPMVDKSKKNELRRMKKLAKSERTLEAMVSSYEAWSRCRDSIMNLLAGI